MVRARNLLATRRSEAYTKELWKGWKSLCVFADNNGYPPPAALEHDVSQLSRLLTAYVQWAYTADLPLQLAKHTLLSVQFLMRHTRGHLQSPWDAVESWSQEQELKMRPPFPLLVLRALVGTARTLGLQNLTLGRIGLSAEYLCFAILLESAFYGLLRPGEMFGIGSDTVGLPGVGVLSGNYAVVAVINPKNARAFGRRQFAVIRNQGASEWLLWALKDRPPGFTLWPWTQAEAPQRRRAGRGPDTLKYVKMR